MDITDHITLDNPDFVGEVDPIPERPSKQSIVLPLIRNIKTENLVATVQKLSSFHTRYYTTDDGVEAAKYISRAFQAIISTSRRTDASVTFFEHSWKQPSVIARIEGSGPNRDQVVIISAHEDSINQGGFLNAPGADDDASGVSCVIEAFRAILESGYKPSRTLEFHTYAAEEVGLRGSQDVANKYRSLGKFVHGHLQLDMTMYTKTPENIVIMTDNVDSDLTSFLVKLVPEYTKKNVVFSKCGYACSDHASWNRAGYRTCMPAETLFEDSNPYMHSVKDLLDKLTPEHGMFIILFSRLSNAG